MEKSVRIVPRIWVRGNLLVLVVILMELARKVLWMLGFVQGFYNNAIIGLALFIGMIAGVDLLRSYAVISWISDLAFDASLSNIENGESYSVKPISSKNLVTGVFLASASFILWASILVGISLANTSFRRLGLNYRFNQIYCYMTLMTGCRRELEDAFKGLAGKIIHYSTVQPQ
ncbi:MAG: hypothetical protein F7C36_06115 [Desulfurococcales archaeon]|nr:hypothetical protein [Desulfurococcales archaeon]